MTSSYLFVALLLIAFSLGFFFWPTHEATPCPHIHKHRGHNQTYFGYEDVLVCNSCGSIFYETVS